jgi:hypothetical protein
MKQLNQGTIDYEDLQTTAKFVTAGLSSGSNAITIKSDPQYIGDLSAGGSGVKATFKVKISTNATIGEYQLPLTLDYQYPNYAQQEKADVFAYTYTPASITIPVTVRIKPEVKIAVIESNPEPLSAGNEGYITLKIRNDGPEDGSKASVKLSRSGNSAIIPTDSTTFIGDFPSGGIAECTFKITASKDATNQVYPVDVLVTYTNSEGAAVTSKTETVGVPVNNKISFAVTSTDPSVAAGTQGIIEVKYKNNGNTTAYETQSRITPHSAVTIDDNTAYLGKIAPGETAVASYTVKVDSAAEPGTYAFDSKLRFRDALGNSQESDTVTVNLQVLPAKSGTIAGLPTGAVIAAIILVIIAAGIGLIAYRRKTRLQ